MTVPQQGLFVNPGQGRSYYFGPDLYIFKAIGAETGQAYALCEVVVSPGGGAPLHRHQREDEAFYIQAGEIEFQLDEATLIAPAGTFLHSPKGQRHSFVNKTEIPATLLIWVTPAGFENFMAEVGRSVQGAVTPGAVLPPADLEKVLAIAPQYGIEILLPPQEA
ncbi:cupin domain-containing protein [Lyngbya confervoides]|uniref:Cupin domain-containing protein n=1 Tax=Lyngbya confervoides BDU141951 TaxID=1574623 RepID=A0ABD4T497_9CYAN|nr:cupin domain-containing protein [Lyngbya confervoides]MCM1983248.1 cupin domain-containing protein [Lyngbya confervoides BDU141951]